MDPTNSIKHLQLTFTVHNSLKMINSYKQHCKKFPVKVKSSISLIKVKVIPTNSDWVKILNHLTSNVLKVTTNTFPPYCLQMVLLCAPSGKSSSVTNNNNTGQTVTLFNHWGYNINGSPVNLLFPGWLCAWWQTKLYSDDKVHREPMWMLLVPLFYIHLIVPSKFTS